MSSPSIQRDQRLLLQCALALFVFTIVVGILNGTDAVDFDHKTLMTHVHAGTLGWISLSVFAASLGLFGPGHPGPSWSVALMRVLPAVTVAAVVAYVTAFLTTTSILRPILGSLAGVAMVGWFAWILARRGAVVLSVPRLAVLAAITSLMIGAVLGVLLGIEYSGEADVLPSGSEGAHPASMVIGFLIPTGMALAEWALRPDLVEVRADRAGLYQVGLPFVGGLLVMVGILADVTPLVALSLPFEVIGVGLLIRRLWPGLRRVNWADQGYVRNAAVTVAALCADIVLFVYIIARYEGDVDAAPDRVVLALDHLMFLGVMTNALFALLDRLVGARLRAGIDHFVVVATNLGVAGFVIGLLADSTPLKRTFTPIMGIGLLVAVVAFSARLWRRPGGNPVGPVTTAVAPAG